MALFKSKEDRRIERTIAIRKTLGLFTRQISKLKQAEDGYVASARQARQKGAPAQEALARKALKATMVQRRRLDQQMLTLRIASQMKDQAEVHGQFASAMMAVSKTIGELFSSVDLTATQKQFELAMGKAHSMEERMDMFLETSNETMFDESPASEPAELVSDEELDKLIDIEAAAGETGMDDAIAAKLAEVQSELGQAPVKE
jgi:hypothetical protein